MYEYPERYEGHVTLKNKENIFVRPLKATDEPLLAELLGNASGLRFSPVDMLDRFMDVDYDSNFALACVVNENGKDSIIAIARYAYSPAQNFTEFGVSVRDDFQNLGLGRHLLKKITDIGREHGYRRFRSMIEPDNKVLLHLLTAYDAHFALKDKSYYVEIVV